MSYAHYAAGARFSSRFMDLVGDGTGSFDMNVNGAVTSVEFKVTCPENTVLLLQRLLIYIEDTGSVDAATYGNGIVLTNGIIADIRDAEGNLKQGIIEDTCPIHSHGDLASYCYDVQELTFGIGNTIVVGRYTFEKDGAPLLLHAGDSFIVYLRDDFTGLAKHRFRIGMTSAHIRD